MDEFYSKVHEKLGEKKFSYWFEFFYDAATFYQFPLCGKGGEPENPVVYTNTSRSEEECS